MEIRNRNIVIIGLGSTGRASCRFFAEQGARIRATDEKPRSMLQDALDELAGLPGGFDLWPYDESILRGADLVVPSPGVPPFNPLLLAARRRGIPVLSELEIASRFLRPPMIAISGTNGKTTTTTLTGRLLEAAGKKVFVGGNIGRPLMDYVRGPQPDDWVVVEVSSFQLQWVETFRPTLAALLNVTCDHVDYHGSFEDYRQVKERLFACQAGADAAILNGDDEGTAALAPRLAARVLRFSSTAPLEGPGICAAGEEIVCSLDGHSRETYPMAMIRLPGRHNVENVMAALLLARLSGCPADTLVEAVSRFSGVAHRIEYVATRKGVAYYDDSKGTNVDAVKRALETFETPVALLMGGRDKEGDFASLLPAVRERVRGLFLFGEARERIGAVLGNAVPTETVPTLREAVLAAAASARSGDVVLLSPGCASFDAFRNYKERGRFFRRIVEEIADV